MKQKIICLILGIAMIISCSTVSFGATISPLSEKTFKVVAYQDTNMTTCILQWSKVDKATSYRIYRAVGSDENYKSVKTLNKTYYYKNRGLKGGKTYYYKVKAYKMVNGKKVCLRTTKPVKFRTADPVAADEYLITFEANLSTGYDWNFSMDNEDTVRVIENYYIQSNPQFQISGNGGIRAFRFKALNPGTVTVTFVYDRHFEENSERDREILTFNVNENLEIEEIESLEQNTEEE